MRNYFFGAVILASLLQGCMQDGTPTASTSVQTPVQAPVQTAAQREEADRATCEAERAKAAEAAQPPQQDEGYDLFRNIGRGASIDLVGSNCMNKRGHTPDQWPHEALFK